VFAEDWDDVVGKIDGLGGAGSYATEEQCNCRDKMTR